MLKKSAAFFLLFFTVFCIFLFINKTAFKSAQYQYQYNIIKADQYLYNDTVPGITMIGTSLSANLKMDSLPGIYNLSLAGLSAFDGLNIIHERQGLPKVILIEMNYCFKPASASFSKKFNPSAYNFLKDHFIVFRDENQPIGITLHYIKSLKKKKAANSANSGVPPAALFLEMLKSKEEQYNSIDTNEINNSIDLLYRSVQQITNSGTRVCFFEMPVNEALQHCAKANMVRANIIRHFSANNKVLFIPSDISHTYRTKDGVHLNEYGLLNYTIYLRKSLNNLSLL